MFRAELTGLLTTTATKVTAAVAILGLVITQVIFVTVLPALARGDIGPGARSLGDDFPLLDLSTSGAQLDTLNPLGASMGGGSIGIALLAVTLLGVLAGTSDDRYGGIVGAALASPKRWPIVAAKAAAVAVVAVAVGVLLAAAGLIILVGDLAVTGIPLAAGAADIAVTLARGVLVIAALSLVGLAVGVLARSQLAGVLAMLAILVIEPVIAATAQLAGGGDLPVWAHYLPLALAQNVIHGGSPQVGVALAAAALVGITAAALAASAIALSRRDI